MNPVKPMAKKMLKQECSFVNDSFDNHTKKTLTSVLLLKELVNFTINEKDNINEETIELLEPYLLFSAPDGRQIFTRAVAKRSSRALECMCVWVTAMSHYHKQSKIFKPKLRLLEVKMAQLKDADDNLTTALSELAAVTALKERKIKEVEDSKSTL